MSPQPKGAGSLGDLRVFPQFSRMVRELLTLVWIAEVSGFVCVYSSLCLSNASSSCP